MESIVLPSVAVPGRAPDAAPGRLWRRWTVATFLGETLGFLVPGVGAQDGDLAAALAHCHGTAAPGIVSISRGISGASRGDGWRAAAADAAQMWLGRMQEAGATLPA